jgi:predicted transcriptional regulator
MDKLFKVISQNKVGNNPEICSKLQEIKKIDPAFGKQTNEKLEKQLNEILEKVKNSTTKESTRMLVSEVLKTNKSGTKSTIDKMELYIPILCKCSGEIMSIVSSHIGADTEDTEEHIGQQFYDKSKSIGNGLEDFKRESKSFADLRKQSL